MNGIIITLSIIGFLLVLYSLGKINLSFQFNRQIETLFRNSKNPSQRTYSNEQIKDLPEPVQRYFNRVLIEGQTYINYVRMRHEGRFKTGIHKGWINIQGEHYATTEKPGFIWKGTTAFFNAFDMYIKENGKLIVRLLALVTMVNATGKQYDQGELLRWLGESVLYPTNLLPSERLQWHPIDDNSSKILFEYNGLSLFFVVRLNQAGEIIEMKTNRYMDENKLEDWIIQLADYKLWNQILIPTQFEVSWSLKTGLFCYAKFHLTEVEYGISERF